jgi:hypothetical protein
MSHNGMASIKFKAVPLQAWNSPEGSRKLSKVQIVISGAFNNKSVHLVGVIIQ